ncbi:MAG: YqgE/AlgH family protein [Sphingobacteriales bacterium]|nr:MAG: YqgE/AlgH family protein [Sphingobacteriales bacterium]
MKIKAGTFLQSAASLDDPAFEKVIIFITEYNSSGATGFVVNKLHGRLLNELAEFSGSVSLSLYAGGPVKNDQLYFVHNNPHLIQDGMQITKDVYLGGNFKQALENINSKSIDENNIKLFVGYCGWDAGQLEQEIEEGSWLPVENETMNVFENY